MAKAPFHDLRSFLEALQAAGELARVPCQVDPELEITQIVQETIRRNGPALLFERVAGSEFPLAINLFGSPRRIELALGRHPAEIGREFGEMGAALASLRPGAMLRNFRSLAHLRFLRPRRVRPRWRTAETDLEGLPALKCWPRDAGRFLTFPMVISARPGGGGQNLGVYRMQITGKRTAIAHWQIGKGGSAHAAETGRGRMPVSVAIGADPATMLAAVCPLPEGLDEQAFAGLLRGCASRLAVPAGSALRAPASAEFLFSGSVDLDSGALEGPFGDHFGHYSHPARFPVFEATNCWRRDKPVYVASVAGKPPQEDWAMGEAVSMIFGPSLGLLFPEASDIWAYPQAGFHNLLAAAVRQRYAKEGVKTALGLLGHGQLSLSKCVVVTDQGVDIRSFSQLLRAIRDNFDPAEDLLVLHRTSQDTLDFTGSEMNMGSKMIVDATSSAARRASSPAPSADLPAGFEQAGAKEFRMLEGTLLAVKCACGRGREVLKELLGRRELAGVKFVAAVSEDVDLNDETSLLWGIFTRFDCARDLEFAESGISGARPRFTGPVGIDATFKDGYPEPVEMDAATVEKVGKRWAEYRIPS